jgi:hypothetical protein
VIGAKLGFFTFARAFLFSHSHSRAANQRAKPSTDVSRAPPRGGPSAYSAAAAAAAAAAACLPRRSQQAAAKQRQSALPKCGCAPRRRGGHKKGFCSSSSCRCAPRVRPCATRSRATPRGSPSSRASTRDSRQGGTPSYMPCLLPAALLSCLQLFCEPFLSK